jgi:hypothetical protein
VVADAGDARLVLAFLGSGLLDRKYSMILLFEFDTILRAERRESSIKICHLILDHHDMIDILESGPVIYENDEIDDVIIRRVSSFNSGFNYPIYGHISLSLT